MMHPSHQVAALNLRALRPLALILLLASMAPLACSDDSGSNATPEAADAGGDTATSGDLDTSAIDTTNNTADTDNICAAPILPEGDADFWIGVAGAPLSLFGPERDPTFEAAFTELEASGFNVFFPWFGVQEVDGVATVSDHFDYWLPPSLSPGRNCDVNNPYTAARGRLGVLFPAFFFSDATGDAALNEAVFRQRFALYRDDCWGGDDAGIAGYETFDEIASQRVVNAFSNLPGPRLENAPLAAEIIHALSDKPVVMVEGPLPLVIEREPGLTPTQREDLLQIFWDAVAAVVPGLDIYGFDVYPVPNEPLTLSADYIAFANTEAPDTQRLAVLQGFSYNAESGRQDPRRGPTEAESRFMALDALAAGAKHLIWYGASALQIDTNDEDRSVWSGVLAAAKLVRDLAPALAAPEVTILASEGAAAIGRTLEGGTLLIALNRTDAPAEATFTFPEPFTQAADYESGEPLTHTGGDTLSLPLAPWEVRVVVAYTCTPG